MARYRKRPTVIDAFAVSELMDALKTGWCAVPDWVLAAYEKGDLIIGSAYIEVNAECGWVCADRRDVLLRKASGEMCLCRSEEFAENHEPVGEP